MPSDTTEYIEITGSITAVIYANDDNGYTVLRLREALTGEEITVVGCIPGATDGETLTVTGVWTTHPSYGEQFRAQTAVRQLPTERSDIFAYLASGVIKGVGAATAALIIGKFGAESLSVIAGEPEKLAEIRGISPQKARAIGADFRKTSAMRALMEFLTAHGLKTSLAVRLYGTYGDMAIDLIHDNPYLITREQFGADFYEADALALSLGYSSDSPQRVEAAVLFELRHNLTNGHTFLPAEKLVAATCQLIGMESDAVETALRVLTENGHIVRETVANCDACYLEGIHRAESYSAERLLQMASIPASSARDIEKTIDDIERESELEYAELQREAIRLAAQSRVMVLTGGPGTGKTTAVRAILAVFDKMRLNTELCAPTGRAAKRMSELTGREAQTIHRLLGAGFSEDKTEVLFRHDENEPLDIGALIVDESSMIDIQLMHALLSALKPTCRLILVGDSDQLPPVGPGNPFSDIIRSGAIPAVRLTEIFRQAKESGIVRAAHEINGGTVPDFSVKYGDMFFLNRSSRQKTAETIVELVSERLPKNMGIHPSQIQVLAPQKKYESGTFNLNLLLQAAVNPASPDKHEVDRVGFTFREGDRVMQVRNNYDMMWRSPDGADAGTGVFNGDIGTITGIDLKRELVTVDFEDRIADYSFDSLTELEPAYAMTVHKSQGSEYRAVILSVTNAAPSLMTRSVLYTAVTRARELLIIVGDRTAVAAMVNNDRRQKRYSGLKTRLSK